MGYATLRDVCDLGFTAQAFVIVPRPWQPEARKGDAIDIATGTIRMSGHGYDPSDLVEFVLLGAGSVPGGTDVGVPYAPVPVDFFRFRLALNGVPIASFYAPGQGWSLQIDPTRRLQRHIDDAAARIDRCLIAQSPPIKVDPLTGKYPAELVGINARMAARAAIPTMLVETEAYRAPVDVVREMQKADDAMLADWMSGKPLLPQAVDQDNMADDAPRARSRRPIGWMRGERARTL